MFMNFKGIKLKEFQNYELQTLKLFRKSVSLNFEILIVIYLIPDQY